MAQLHTTMPDELYNQLRERAQQERRPLADIVRIAVEDYLRSVGIQVVETQVKRGGDRRSKPSADLDAETS